MIDNTRRARRGYALTLAVALAAASLHHRLRCGPRRRRAARAAQREVPQPEPAQPEATQPEATQPEATQPAPRTEDPPPRRPPPPRRDPDVYETGRVDVVGSAPRALDAVPGSATVVRREDLEQLAPQHGGDVLRTVPGVNVVGEDPMGLRLNISIRGLDPNRSRHVLVLEDGVPVSLNPYGSPELYYAPPIERMDRVEVVRGSGQILWGPQTIGGVINFITRAPPRRPTVSADLRYGSYGYFLANVSGGATHGAFGWRVDAIHRRFTGPRSTDVEVTNLNTRLQVRVSSRSTLGLKLDFYDEGSRSTYLGLTQRQYETDPSLNNASNDRFDVRRYAVAVTHQHLFSSAVALRTNFYAYQTNRAWRRQEFDRMNVMGADYERGCDGLGRCAPLGDPGSTPMDDGSSVYFRRTAAIRNRAFNVAGIEPRLTWTWARGANVTGELNAVVRFHYETAHTQILVGDTPTTRSGDIREEEVRNGYAIAAAIQHRFTFWDRFSVTPGLRFEGFWSNRRIERVGVTDPATNLTRGSDVDIYGKTFSPALIPGVGLTYRVVRPVTLFAGFHRGYAPPRTQDAVSAAGANLNLDAELSWNTEAGARVRLGRWLTAEANFFHIEFENQIIPPSESGGDVAAGGFNSGHSRHMGAEASVTFNLAPLVSPRNTRFSLPLTVNYTWLPIATFIGGLHNGNRLPYAPEHILYAQLRFIHRIGLSAQVGVTYVASQFADAENTRAGSPDGLVGQLPQYLTLDARVGYTVPRSGVTVYVSGRNLTDQIYIANRAPQGIQPAGWRQVFAGLEWTWPRS
ncbi:MAG: TonB-dependent receptor [Polyangiales bacterium]